MNNFNSGEVFGTDPEATTPPLVPSAPASAVDAPTGYELLGELGRGGMGVVYKARQIDLNRVVALKMILAGGHADPEDRARFLAEAEAVARVKHAGIVQVFDFGTHAGLPYFSLELCEGGSLADRLRDGPLPPRTAAQVVEQVARAVQAAHEAGIVHRDLKPGNVLLARDGSPRVADFGLAKRVEGGGRTQTGAVIGTPSYMAPEQAEAKKTVGPLADVWALGAILYCCLTGRPPFQAATSLDTILQVVADDPVPARRLNGKVPLDLETICHKCLRKNPAERYRSAVELADDLRRYQDGELIRARRVSPLERGWRWAKKHPGLVVTRCCAGLTPILIVLTLRFGELFRGAAISLEFLVFIAYMVIVMGGLPWLVGYRQNAALIDTFAGSILGAYVGGVLIWIVFGWAAGPIVGAAIGALLAASARSETRRHSLTGSPVGREKPAAGQRDLWGPIDDGIAERRRPGCLVGPTSAAELPIVSRTQVVETSTAHYGAAPEATSPPPVAPALATPVDAPAGYELLGELGRGGMGVVYKARQIDLNRVVALKMILAGSHAGPEDRARFLAEAEAIAKVKHAGIVQVFDFGTHAGLPYFSLELCEGGSLADRLRDGPLPPRAAAQLVEQVARAVQAAHEAGIVHRDLKPGNVLLARDGSPRVADFGLAKRVEGGGRTQTGAVIGTPSYMAPEQAEAKKTVGPLADVWALGAILYCCLTGRPPFQAATSLDTILQVVADDPVPARRLNGKVPLDLETICHKCLRKNPAERYRSAVELADDLRRYQDGELIRARRVSPLERGWRWAKKHPGLVVTRCLLGLVLITVLNYHNLPLPNSFRSPEFIAGTVFIMVEFAWIVSFAKRGKFIDTFVGLLVGAVVGMILAMPLYYPLTMRGHMFDTFLLATGVIIGATVGALLAANANR